ncbi:MAG: double-strand break repair helicase AddA [Rhizobiales bacterium]|nr:double-strand break repair helicase AddA [Hyphomicrobiales bacterium]
MSRAIPQQTRASQLAASDPAKSAWVTAHAGSGKTYVLTQRVIRLLLADTPPSRILCLTFTKAAAANMAERVFARLRAWATMEASALDAELQAIAGAPPDAATRARARTLFARAIETPGGLKVQTIHAFCERLLHQFPFEANAPARFRVAEELQQHEMIAAATSDAFRLAAAEPEGALARAVARLADEMSREEVTKALREALARRDHVGALLTEFGDAVAMGRALAARLGLRPEETVAALERAILEDGLAGAGWRDVAARLQAGSPNDQRLAKRLSDAARQSDVAVRIAAYASVFFKDDGAPFKDAVTAGLKRSDPTLEALLVGERERVAPLLDRRKAALLVERTQALLALAQALLAAYAQRKARANLLDFPDLIGRAEAMLAHAPNAWVMYKLDQGVDHILVDEAQDTSPQQWSILLALAQEFFAGAGRASGPRTLFAVGDEKQSIFSFQGAAPRMFEETRVALMRRFAEQERGESFADVRLNLSFRSTRAILEAVDAVFDRPENRRAVTSDPAPPPHMSWKSELPGLVEIWPVIEPGEAAKPTDWSPRAAVAAGEGAPAVRLARRIAGRVAAFLAPDSPDRVHGEDGAPRRVRPGDVMILVRTRGAVFEATIREMKARGLPVAGADRIRLADHIAVLDLLAAGRAALLPPDDLTLACVLKSPLIGLDDDDLIALAPRRPGSLAEALAAAREPRRAQAAARLALWRADAARLAPFAFFARRLGEEGGRRAFLERLGPEAGDVIDEFMKLALEHEQTGAPSLQLFLDAVASGEIEIKREGEPAGLVRVMTAHAAKGLEAKIVILPETTGAPFSANHAPKLAELPRPDAPHGAPPFLVAVAKKNLNPPAATQAAEAVKAEAEDEQRRLLYVALTRAEEQLVVAGCKGKSKLPAGCWHELVSQALEADPALVEAPAPWGEGETILRRAVGAPPPARQRARPPCRRRRRRTGC